MFDFDPGKLLIIGVVALIVIGPKDLPRVLRTVGQMVRRMRRMAGEFQSQFMEAMNEADLAEVKKELNALHESAKVDMSYDPAAAVRHEMTSAIEAPRPATPNSEASGAEAAKADAPEPAAESGPSIASKPDAPASPPTMFAEPEHAGPAAEPGMDAEPVAQQPAYDLVRKSVGDSRG
jgi:sec-independent protein translocase protein TatB